MAERKMVLELTGHEVAVSNPSKVYFPRAGVTKLDMVRYYLAVAPGALGGVRGRPMALKRFVNGAEAEPFFQKRAPENLPAWIRTATLTFPSGRTYAAELQNFANWFTYYRKRKLMLAGSMGQVLSQVRDVRGGIVKFNATSAVTMYGA